MANSRLEKIGTIYTRTRGLIQSGALNYKDRPIWYDIYESYPPKEEPRFDRPAPNMKYKEIFYAEDKIRGKLHHNVKGVGTVNLLNRNSKSFTQRFIETYKKLESQYGEGQCEEDNLFSEALGMLKKDREAQVYHAEEYTDGSLTTAFKNATIQQRKSPPLTSTINVKDLFKE